MDKMIGKRSVQFEVPPCIIGAASVAGEKEGAGKFGKYFGILCRYVIALKPKSWYNM